MASARRITPSAINALLVLATFSATPVSAQASQPTVVAIDGVLCDLTRTLVASDAKVVCLIQPGSDPHNYRLKPSDRQALSSASLVLHNGYNLTPSANKISGSTKVVAVAEKAIPINEDLDPHVWHDPANSAAMVTVIAERLAPVLPSTQQSALTARAAEAINVLNRVGDWGGKQFATIPENQRVLVSEHKAYSYLTNRYGLRQITMLDSYTTGGVLRPSSLRTITAEVQGSGAQTLFPESLPVTKTLRRISRSTGLPVNGTPLFADGLAPDRSTVGTATLNICTVVQGQGGQCDQAAADELMARWSAIR
ncbi:metal ABC transporter substrate-binding protein [Prochlorococcus marinus]|uniref:metal ABC transporter substrate-binding protein n=1 Tax=Prochlorococcus marinus TaxID=1219 RepID=UPI0007B382CA|nr:metal ABC transporter substrate-binding protein [Prochlorococcus marinus]KZR73437.1 Periplasmic zinc-binding protein TroA precursor [Prochlorococcus marinus str. MIT 1320]